MEENKETLNEELQEELDVTETPAEPDTSDTEEITAETAEAAEAEEVETDGEADEAPEQPKKKKLLQRTIIISIAIVAVTVLITIICRLFFFNGVQNTDIFGNNTATTWHYQMTTSNAAATADEAKAYDFNLTFDNGKLNITVGTIEVKGSYSLRNITKEDAANLEGAESKVGTPVLIIENSTLFDGTYTYEVSGNVFTGKTMTISNISYDDRKYTFDDKVAPTVTVEREGEFHGDDKIVGSWQYKDELGTISYTFNSDGSYVRTDKQSGIIQTQKGIYDCQNGALTLTLNFGDEVSDAPRSYQFKDDKLVLNEFFNTIYGTVTQPIEYTKQ